jgi:hypothetical protein
MGDSRQAVLIVSITILVLATMFMVLRFCSRLLIVKRIGHHDYWSLFAWVSVGVNCRGNTRNNNWQILDFGLSFSLIYGVKMGLGLPGADIDPGNRPRITRVMFAFTVLYVS